MSTALIKPAYPTGDFVGPSGITTTYIADGNVTAAKIETNVNLAGNTVKENGKNVVVTDDSTISSKMIWGEINSDGTTFSGAGFSSVRNSAGTYTISFSESFGNAPAAVITPLSAAGFFWVSSAGTSSFVANTRNSSNVVFDVAFSFIAIGRRP